MTNTPSRHHVERQRQEPKRRTLTVTGVLDLSPRMRRIELTSPELADFSSPAPDDHIKLILPDTGTPAGEVMRDYTPRRYDAENRSLTIDFALHESGPATAWARAARPGNRLVIAGPKGSTIVPDDFDWYLLAGDETALPAIGRRLENLRTGVPVTTVVLVDGPEHMLTFDTATRHTPIWVFRQATVQDDAGRLRAGLEGWTAPEGEGYVWIAAEARAARALKTYMLEERRHPQAWLKASGYWVRGEAGAYDKLHG